MRASPPALAALAALALMRAAAADTPRQESSTANVWSFGRFGGVTVYLPSDAPRDVALVVSGDEGWSSAAASMARRLAAHHAVVAGIDLRHYLAQLESSSDKCVSPAGDFENLSRYLQSRLSIGQYLQPTLVGYASGAALVYATLAEAPEASFKGALSIGFCPELELSKAICKGTGLETSPRKDAQGANAGVELLPARNLSGRWISLQGEGGGECAAAATRKFFSKVPRAEMVVLPKAGHERSWGPRHDQAFERLTAPTPDGAQAGLPSSVSSLPLTVMPTKSSGGAWFAVFLSGDGGWVGLDRGVSQELVKHDIPVVGWDSLKYFWSPRNPQGAADDLDRVIRYFASRWNRGRVLLIGYSQGADTMPFMVNRLPAATRGMVGLTALLGISDNALFEFHVANWLGNTGGGLPTAAELEHWSGAPYLCLYGADDPDSACAEVTGKEGVVVRMPGGHHFGGGYPQIAAQILKRLPRP